MVKIGIIGAGRIGQVHTKGICTGGMDVKIQAIADPYMNDRTAAWAKSIGIPRVTLDYREVLSDASIDAVLICSSTDTHAALSLEAIASGKHVFCEKPIDFSIAKIREVMGALEGKGLKYQVGFNRRFDHNFRAVKQAVLEGRIGEVQIVKITSRDPLPPPISYVKTSGGLFMDMMIHDFDMACYLAGSEAEEVYASGAVLVDPAIGEAGDIDTAIVSLRLRNGALAVIDNSRQAVYGYDQRAEVFGSKGAAATANDAPSTAVISDEEGVHGEKPLYFFLERYLQAYRDEIRAFIKAIEENGEPAATAADGLRAVVTALAAQKSIEEHRPVSIKEIEDLS